MFDIDSRVILAEIEPDVFFLTTLLDALPGMCPTVWQDEQLNSLYSQMRARAEALYPAPDDEGREVEKYLVCGLSKQC